MKKTLAFTIALPTILGATSCTETSGDAARLEQSIDKIATAVRAIADGGTAASPVIQEIDTGEGTKMVILAFANGDYQAWSISAEGTIQGAGYQQGKQSYRLTPGGFTETR